MLCDPSTKFDIYVWLFVASIEKRDVKAPATWRVFGNHRIIHDKFVWEFKLFLLFRGIEMAPLYKLIVCVIGFCNRINPFITKYIKKTTNLIYFITVTVTQYPYYYPWNNKTGVVISSSITSGSSSCMGLLPDTQNCECACAGNAGNIFPATTG